MIDPLLSLAFAMQANKGVYALLIGSGVSRTAQIPTGWEIVLDLITKLAHMQGQDCGSDPAAWFRQAYGEEPDYSKLLEEIAKSPVERQQLLASYFEPTEEEREQELKLPTKAHRAIAELVASEHVRLIVTTNFDRLIERAIEDKGITPIVISTPDALDGALPLVHQKCCVIKIHGDYLDARIKNTPTELAKYEKRTNSLLDRVLDEFGIVACGWSAKWDLALCAAFDRCKSRRFTMYWAGRGPLEERAERLVKARGGIVLKIKDADAFFTELAEKVESLDEMQRPHPLSITAAIATVKRLLANDNQSIRLHDLVSDETERAYSALQPEFAQLLRPGDQSKKFQHAVSRFVGCIELFRSIAIQGAYWGKPEHHRLFAHPIQRLAESPTEGQGGRQLDDSLRAIPSIILMYAMGLSSLANSNFGMLVAILTQPTSVETRRGVRSPLLTTIDWELLQEWFKKLPGHERNHVPASEWLFKECREPLRSFIRSDNLYEQLFDRFELISSLVFIDLAGQGTLREGTDSLWAPSGRFARKYAQSLRWSSEANPFDEFKKDTAISKGLTANGLFSGRPELFANVVDRHAAHIAEIRTSFR